MERIDGTTIAVVRRGNEVAMAGDGQVTMGESVIMKGNACKIRRIHNNEVLCGFAGATADAFTLVERFEGKLKKYQGDIMRSAVELARDWRTDKMLRRLEAMLLVADKKNTLLLSGTGDVIEPERDVIAIGSGGNFAYAAAWALCENTDLLASEIARKSLEIAAGICVFTNDKILVESLGEVAVD